MVDGILGPDIVSADTKTVPTMDDAATVRLISGLAERLRSAASVAEDKWSSLISVPLGFFDAESIQCGKIALSPCAVTEPGEVVRLDDHVFDGMPFRLRLQQALTREIEPFIIGVGEVRMVRKDSFDGLIVLRTKVAEAGLDHVEVPLCGGLAAKGWSRADAKSDGPSDPAGSQLTEG